ncbi:MAG: rhamnulokinase [Ruminococcus sp.]|nr:rhamnulokinase [Ruminococcus sp.]
MGKRVLCFDFGASSGRAVIAHVENMTVQTEEVHRFKNRGVNVNGTLYWDILSLYSEIKTGLVKAHRAGGFSSVGIDTWGVDYGIIDKNGRLMSNPVQYRDKRTEGMVQVADKLVGLDRLYALTGTQIMPINTAFQLLAEKNERPYMLEHGAYILPTPDLLCYMLTGKVSAELSIASTTQFLNPLTLDWSDEAIEALGLPRRLFPKIVKPGESKGMLSEELCQELNIPQAEVIAVCGHDTQCAYYASPSSDDNPIIISCGTWSLVGTVIGKPVLTAESAELGITNEVGVNGQINLLKNITGLWLVQETKAFLETLGQEYSYAELSALAREEEGFTAFIDTDASEFSTAGNMPQRIKDYCIKTGQLPPENLGQVMRTIYLSLAMKYRLAIEQLGRLTGNHPCTINMVGGGIRDTLLCQLTADICNMDVTAGPVEATVLGNAILQLVRNGEIKDEICKCSVVENTARELNELSLCKPQKNYDEDYKLFKNIINFER